MSSPHVILTGWEQGARRVERYAVDLRGRLQRAVVESCVLLVGEIKSGILDQAPGGRRFPPLHPYTVKRRLDQLSAKVRARVARMGGETEGGGSGHKRLVANGDLLSAIGYALARDGLSGTVGVNRQAKSASGRSMVDIARVQFEGATIRVTEKMRAYLAATGLPLRRTTTHLVIPAADPIRPTYQANRERIIERLKAAVRGD